MGRGHVAIKYLCRPTMHSISSRWMAYIHCIIIYHGVVTCLVMVTYLDLNSLVPQLLPVNPV